MLQRFTVKNLGCFSEQECSVDFSPETILVGPNNSGKSLFLAGINLLRHYSVAGSQAMTTEYYNLVGFAEAVHTHDLNRAIEMSLTARRGDEERVFTLTLRYG